MQKLLQWDANSSPIRKRFQTTTGSAFSLVKLNMFHQLQSKLLFFQSNSITTLLNRNLNFMASLLLMKRIDSSYFHSSANFLFKVILILDNTVRIQINSHFLTGKQTKEVHDSSPAASPVKRTGLSAMAMLQQKSVHQQPNLQITVNNILVQDGTGIEICKYFFFNFFKLNNKQRFEFTLMFFLGCRLMLVTTYFAPMGFIRKLES